MSHEFTIPSSHLEKLVGTVDVDAELKGRRALALIDPYERSKRWLLRSPLEPRPAKPRYQDYADLMRRMPAA